MSAPYTISEVSNITSPLLIGNELMGNMIFGHMLLITVFLVTTFTIAGSKTGDIMSGLTMGAVIAFICNIVLLPLNIVSPIPLIFWLIILMACLFLGGKGSSI